MRIVPNPHNTEEWRLMDNLLEHERPLFTGSLQNCLLEYKRITEHSYAAGNNDD